MSLRNILRNLNIQRQQSNMGQYNKTMKEYQQERGIKDALRQQTIRDDIILAQEDFVPLDARRREKRIDDNIKTSMALLVDGLNEESVPKLSVNLDRIQDIILKENPSLSILAQLKRFLIQLEGRIKEIDIDETIINDKIKTTSSLLQNKIITDDVMKDVLKDVSSTVVDEMNPDSIFNVYSRLVPKEEQKIYIKDGKDRPSLYRMKQEIKRIMGDSIEELKDPIKSTVQNVRKLKEDVKRIHADYSMDELAELFTNQLKGQISTQIGRVIPTDEWKNITDDKNKMINLLSDYYSQPKVPKVSQFPESIDKFMQLSQKLKKEEMIPIVQELFRLTNNSEPEELSEAKISRLSKKQLIDTRDRLIQYIFDTFATERSSVPDLKADIKGKLTNAQRIAREKREKEQARVRANREAIEQASVRAANRGAIEQASREAMEQAIKQAMEQVREQPRLQPSKRLQLLMEESRARERAREASAAAPLPADRWNLSDASSGPTTDELIATTQRAKPQTASEIIQQQKEQEEFDKDALKLWRRATQDAREASEIMQQQKEQEEFDKDALKLWRKATQDAREASTATALPTATATAPPKGKGKGKSKKSSIKLSKEVLRILQRLK